MNSNNKESPKRLKHKIGNLHDWFNDLLRGLCGRLTPEKRLITILLFCLLFGAASIYMFVSSIYYIGKSEGIRQMEIDHIEQPALLKPPSYRDSIESINNLRDQNYEQPDKQQPNQQ